ncbi:hypothetical protein Tsubulata_029998 [Turnera subulata]|uniref:V-SNARE coiled-coil homology domain-containing protein n=1 Tax=Turnera subulata TaxID=218843 RepID=A0A9Q0JHF2_9ROSI|nr:hypothetical protein Tsubulata_029998 [Turnera subulata]
MFAKLFQKQPAAPPQQQSAAPPSSEENVAKGILDPRIAVHYGIPSTASRLAFDPVQSLLAIATLDGRIKVIGASNVEGLLVSPKPLPFKHLEFLQNQGFLVSVTNENEIQVWDLEQRRTASVLKWESNITAFSIICGSSYIYVGDEYGMVSVLKFDTEEAKIMMQPYYVPTYVIAEISGTSVQDLHSVVGLLPQPGSQGNRLLIAYEDGLIVLWDVSEDKIVLVRGNKDLQLKCKVASMSHSNTKLELSDDASDHEQVEKEISSLCWASSDGSVLAVGYVDGDIMLWNLSTLASTTDRQAEKSQNDVVKLQLSSGDRRLPVIVLHWAENRSRKDCRGQLFVYGGDAIGSEELLTILSLDWSSGIEGLKCIGRVDLTLDGSFADMVIVRSAGAKESYGTFVLTNPGQLSYFDDPCLLSSVSQRERRNSVSSIQYPVAVPTIEPYMTVAKLGLVYKDGTFSRALSKTISAARHHAAHAPESINWPLTGGVPCQLFDAEDYQVERLYIAGYRDGSIRLWDATSPAFALIYVLGPEIKDTNFAGMTAPISALGFCSWTLSLAVGNELGMVHLYKLIGSAEETSLNFVTDNGKEVHTISQGDGPKCTAVFSFLSSPICTLQFVNSGARLAVGFHCGKVAMLDLNASSVLFITDSLSDTSSPISSLAVRSFSDIVSLSNSSDDAEAKKMEEFVKCEVFVLTSDALVVIDGNIGSVSPDSSVNAEGNDVISEVVTGNHSSRSTQNMEANSEPAEPVSDVRDAPPKDVPETSGETPDSGQSLETPILLLCCKDVLHLYSLQSLVEGNPIREVKLLKSCCWTTMFKKENKYYGLIVLYQTGDIEIRCLPDLEVVGESSLMSILRWNFKTNMEKTICSSESGHIILVNGCEFAGVCLLAFENDFRIPESFPCLHDQVLAAAAASAVKGGSSSHEKQMQVEAYVSGGFLKGFRTVKAEHDVGVPEVYGNDFAHLESIFSNPPFLKPSTTFDDQKILELNIDDIDVDEPVLVSPLRETSKNDSKDKGTERQRLFEGATTKSEPKARTVEEIKAKYRKEDASTAAAQAKDKLVERGEKLEMQCCALDFERLSLRTAELQSGAEDFASMAQQLAKQMEKRKWWNI